MRSKPFFFLLILTINLCPGVGILIIFFRKCQNPHPMPDPALPPPPGLDIDRCISRTPTPQRQWTSVRMAHEMKLFTDFYSSTATQCSKKVKKILVKEIGAFSINTEYVLWLLQWSIWKFWSTIRVIPFVTFSEAPFSVQIFLFCIFQTKFSHLFQLYRAIYFSPKCSQTGVLTDKQLNCKIYAEHVLNPSSVRDNNFCLKVLTNFKCKNHSQNTFIVLESTDFPRVSLDAWLYVTFAD